MKKLAPILILFCFLLFSCADSKNTQANLDKIKKLEMEYDSLSNVIKTQNEASNSKLSTFLTFQKDNAEQAMNFYISLFDNSKVLELQRWGKEGPGKEGAIMHAVFSLDGKQFMCSDSPPIHEWDFSPAVSNFIQCENENEINRLFEKLSENGEVTMPLNNYGFSDKFGWVIDQFGVSWQLNLG